MLDICCYCCFPGPSNEKSPNQYAINDNENGKVNPNPNLRKEIGGQGESIEMVNNPGFYDASEVPYKPAEGMTAEPAEEGR